MKHGTALIIASIILVNLNISAGNDPSIKGATRSGIQNSMKDHVSNNKVDGKYVVYDARTNKLLKLDFDKVHEGIVKKDGFYVSCADFKDSSGKIYDIDFLAAKSDSGFQVVDAIIHKVGNQKRPYSLSHGNKSPKSRSHTRKKEGSGKSSYEGSGSR